MQWKPIPVRCQAGAILVSSEGYGRVESLYARLQERGDARSYARDHVQCTRSAGFCGSCAALVVMCEGWNRVKCCSDMLWFLLQFRSPSVASNSFESSLRNHCNPADPHLCCLDCSLTFYARLCYRASNSPSAKPSPACTRHSKSSISTSRTAPKGQYIVLIGLCADCRFSDEVRSFGGAGVVDQRHRQSLHG